MLIDQRGKPFEPSWLMPSARRLEVLQLLRAQADAGNAPSLEAALYYCDWPLAIRLIEAELQARPDSRALDAILGLAFLRQGDVERAYACWLRAALLAPNRADVEQLYWELALHAAQRRRTPNIPNELRCFGRIRLELLGVEHWQDLLWQYEDPSIQHLCRWPRLERLDDLERFLAGEQARGDVLVFAVSERSFGFCGAVSLIFHEGVGFVSYWLGREFRGHGFATEAVECVLRLATESFGMHTCYATVLVDNWPSRRLLSRVGFQETALEPLPPYTADRVYRRGSARAWESVRQEAVRLFANMQSLVQLELPVAA